MKILWIVNSMMPVVAKKLGFSGKGSGGWLTAMLVQLSQILGVELMVATASHKVTRTFWHEWDGIKYVVLSTGKNKWHYNRHLEKQWKQIQDTFQPDIIHIHGTEFLHGLAYIRACGSKGVVISLQGMVGEIGEHYFAGISESVIRETETWADRLLHRGIIVTRGFFQKMGEYEREYLQSVKYVIGRTEWDRNVAMAINPRLTYCINNECLNEVYYKNIWHEENCEPHSIFVSQCSYPIKGFHFLLQAMPYVISEFPDTKVYVAGAASIYPSTIKKRLLKTGYNHYLQQLIDQNNLREYVHFVGALSPDEMCQQYLKRNVFVMCSAVENSSNSLGEAQILGMPTVVSRVAGNVTMTNNGEIGLLYEYDNYKQLAEQINNIFGNRYALQMLETERDVAMLRHDRSQNIKVLMSIYNFILENK